MRIEYTRVRVNIRRNAGERTQRERLFCRRRGIWHHIDSWTGILSAMDLRLDSDYQPDGMIPGAACFRGILEKLISIFLSMS